MFDINATINQAIAAAVEAHITGLQQAYANNIADMAERIAALEAKLAAQAPSEGLANADAPLVSMFVSELNDQEWFWDKVNAYINRNSESVSDTVKDEWRDWMEDEVASIAERAIGDADLDDAVRSAVRDLTFTVTVD